MVNRVTVDYLRLSITNRCNLNCLYCRPRPAKLFSPAAILSDEEIIKIVKLLVVNGIRKVRITGGEPLLKEGVADLVGRLSNIRELEEISMTTNGTFLKKWAGTLKRAGLGRINLSLDTLRKPRYTDITGQDRFNDVWEGIEQALGVGLWPVKLNVVVMKNINDDEVLDFIELACRKKIIVRFIELFSTHRENYQAPDYFIPNSSVRKKIETAFGCLEEAAGIKGGGPAQYFKVKQSSGIVGFIDTVTSEFCQRCSRIRMSCDGKLYQCLFSSKYLDLSKFAASPEFIQRFIAGKRYHTKNTVKPHPFEMSLRGG